jgi:hypothetical protein
MTPSGIRLTLPHWYGFAPGIATSRSPVLTDDEWDRLREKDSAFGFGRSREEWIAQARSNPAVVRRADSVVSLLDAWGAERLVSAGVGTGLFEYLLKTALPRLFIRCGDWSPDSLQLLRERFTECDSVERMDLRRPDWAKDPDAVVLLNRVDMELTDGEWRECFSRMATVGVKRIVWIPCGLLNGRSIIAEIRGVLAGIGMRRQLARSGYLRTPARMGELFSDRYERHEVLTGGDLPAWGLHLRTGQVL